MTNMPFISLDDDGPVARLVFDQPQTLNAITAELAIELRNALKGLSQRSGVRALIISGAGRAFMSGGDLTGFHAAGAAGAPDEADRIISPFHEAVRILLDLPFPVIAQVHGVAAGAGLSIVLACDFALAADDTKFAFAYSRIAATPDGGLSWLLPQAVGFHRALRFAFIDDVIDAVSAERLGLITHSVPAADLLERTMIFADKLAAKPMAAFAETKRLLRASFSQDIARHLDAEHASFRRSAASADFAEGVTAFFEKRKPRFSD